MTSTSKKRKQNEEFTKLRLEAIEYFIKQLESWIGNKIRITECITRNAPSRNRHHSTLSVFLLEVESVGVQFSGAQITIYGKHNLQYGISMDLLTQWEFETADELNVTERFTSNIERYTTVTLAENIE